MREFLEMMGLPKDQIDKALAELERSGIMAITLNNEHITIVEDINLPQSSDKVADVEPEKVPCEGAKESDDGV